MRLFKIYSWALLLCLGVLSACNDYDYNYYIVNPVPESSTDLTQGYNSLIIKYDTLSKVVIAVSEPVIVSNTSPLISYEQETDARGATVLRPKVANPKGLGIVNVDQVTLTSQGNPQKSKTISVTILRYPRQAAVNEIKERLLEVLGRGIDPLAEIGTTKGSVLNRDLVAAVNGALDWSSTIQSTYGYRNEGTDYNKTVRSRQHQSGLDLVIPIKKILFKPSFSITHTTVDITENRYEYMTGTVGTKCAEGQIREDALINNNPIGFRAVMDETLNNVLNNPGSDSYKIYSNDPKGLAKLLDNYGTSFYTSVLLGGSANITWMKKQDMSSHSLSMVINASISVNKTEPTETSKKLNSEGKDTLTTVLNSYSYGGTASYGFTQEDLDVMEHSELTSSMQLIGGNCTEVQDFNQWHVTDQPAKWVPIAYATKDQLDQMQMSGKNPSIHSILELCDSVNSNERYNALKEFLQPDEDGLIPYYLYTGKYEDMKKGHWIIADVIMVARSYDDSKYAPILTFECPHDRKTRLYYPLVTNPNVNDQQKDRVGYSVSLNAKCYHGAGFHRNVLLTMYYAMEWEENSKPSGCGITKITIAGSDDPGKDIYKRGDYSDAGVDGDPKGGKHYLVVHYANKDTKPEDKVTAIGVYNTEWDEDNGDKRGLVFASSAGMEWMADQGWETQANKDFFNSYWGKDNKKWTRGEYGAQFNSIVDIKKKRRPRTAHVCYTTEAITKDLSGITETEGDALQKTFMEKVAPINIPLDHEKK
ncbi:MAG: hypothetical protein MJY76_02465 [Bacteroidales bacterium]|nr:hypothetical protein [Bacteroidales bacterium]